MSSLHLLRPHVNTVFFMGKFCFSSHFGRVQSFDAADKKREPSLPIDSPLAREKEKRSRGTKWDGWDIPNKKERKRKRSDWCIPPQPPLPHRRATQLLFFFSRPRRISGRSWNHLYAHEFPSLFRGEGREGEKKRGEEEGRRRRKWGEKKTIVAERHSRRAGLGRVESCLFSPPFLYHVTPFTFIGERRVAAARVDGTHTHRLLLYCAVWRRGGAVCVRARHPPCRAFSRVSVTVRSASRSLSLHQRIDTHVTDTGKTRRTYSATPSCVLFFVLTRGGARLFQCVCNGGRHFITWTRQKCCRVGPSKETITDTVRSFVGVALDFAAGRNLGEEEEDDNHATVVFALNSVDPKKKKSFSPKDCRCLFLFF